MEDLGKILKEEENRKEGNTIPEEGKEVGQVFKDYANDIRTVYGTYCKGQDSASQYLDKVSEERHYKKDIWCHVTWGLIHVLKVLYFAIFKSTCTYT